MMVGMTRPSRWLIGGTAYAGVVGCLALAGGLTQRPQPYLAALVLTLPLGLAALIGVYGGYALINGVGGLFVSASGSGNEPLWLRGSSATLDVILFVAAAVGNVLLARVVLRARRRSRQSGP
jgi:hypothetical protein